MVCNANKPTSSETIVPKRTREKFERFYSFRFQFSLTTSVSDVSLPFLTHFREKP